MKNWLFLIVILFASCEDSPIDPIDIGNIEEIDVDITVSSDNIPEDLIVWYPFNNNSNDESGNELHATPFDAILDVDRHNVVNSSYKFSINKTVRSEKDNILITEHDDKMNVESFTLFAWIKPHEKTGEFRDKPSTIMSRWDGDDLEDIFRFQILDNGEIHLQLNNDSFFSGYIIEYDTWSHVAVSYDKGVIKFYVNSILVNLTQTETIIDQNISHLTIGETWMKNGYWYNFNGNLDDVGISNGSLTECEIKKLYEL